MNALDRPTVVANVVLFQVGWFACVLGAAQGQPWIGVVAAVAVVAWNGLRAACARSELTLVAIAVLIGALFDSILSMLGWIAYMPALRQYSLAPLWILALWALFATTINVSMRWLKPRLWLAALLGAVGGPLSYWAAERMGAVHFAEPFVAVFALAIGWALVMPVLLIFAHDYDGFASQKAAAR
jgi:Protein of unknown function (DUF2878)